MKVSGFALAFFVLLGLVFSPRAEAVDRVCKQWYKKKKYVKASRCFYTLAVQSMSKPTLSEEQREQVGVWLRNAALSLKKAAQLTDSAENASYLREQAISYLDLYLKKKFYDSNTQKTSAVVQRTSLRDKVGYTTLTITTDKATHSIQVTGFRFSLTKKGSWSKKVRPGNYTVLVRTEKGLSKAQVVKLLPRKPQVLNIPVEPPKRRKVRRPPPPRPVKPPPKANNPPVGPWVVIGLGAASAVVSITMFSLGARERAEGDALYETVKSGQGSLEQTRSLLQYQEASNLDFTIGWVFASIAVVTTTAGIIWYVLHPKAKAEKDAQPPSAPPQDKKTSLLFFSE
ncbi:MAG: hypothetical protein EP343_15500 [Deltaproteobacteria bacterium]|nr:MAG: hypothetical protein EP343_15500 [Deltaproteobacteria bacterium]